MSLLHWQSVDRMGGSLKINAADLCSLSVSPRVRKFGREMVLAAEGHPILDVACGGGRNGVWLAHLGGRVVGIDVDLRGIEAERETKEKGSLNDAFRRIKLLNCDLIREPWPYPPQSVGGIVNIHFLEESLLPRFCDSLISGGLLILETVEARGENYFELPKAGFLREALEQSLSLLVYNERSVGPHGVDAVTVKLVGKKL